MFFSTFLYFIILTIYFRIFFYYIFNLNHNMYNLFLPNNFFQNIKLKSNKKIDLIKIKKYKSKTT